MAFKNISFALGFWVLVGAVRVALQSVFCVFLCSDGKGGVGQLKRLPRHAALLSSAAADQTPNRVT